LCEKNCLFKEYNKDTKRVLCECEIKNNFMHLSEILNKTSELLYNIPGLIEINDKRILSSNLTETVNTEESINSFLESEILKNDIINGNKSEIIIGEKDAFQIATQENQTDSLKNNKNNTISIKDLGECGDLLKAKNNISDNDSLIIRKVDIKKDNTTSTQIEYEVYNLNTSQQLDLSICKDNDIKIDVYSPVNLNEDIYDLAKHLKEQGYDLFNSNDSFYNDFCSPYSSTKGTDVILADRKNQFYNSNITLCDDNCEYKGFDTESRKAKCECNTKTETNSNFDANFSPNEILEKIQQLMNVKVFSCYKLVFSLKGLKNNLGSYILITILTLFITIMIINFITINNKITSIFTIIISQYESMIQQFNEKKDEKDLKHKKIKNNEKVDNNNDESKNILKLKKKIKNNDNVNNPIKKNNKFNIYNNDNNQKNKIKNKKIKEKSENTRITKKSQLINIDNSQSNNNIINSKVINKFYNSPKKIKDLNSISKQNIIKDEKIKENKTINKIINYIPKEKRKNYLCDDELNNLKYEEALEIDFRSYNQFYLSLLKETHSLIFTFFVKNDYNIFLLKLSLFLFNFAILYFMNAIFCTDDTMHKLYEDEGEFDFVYEIPKTIYSTLITQIISSLLENLSLSQDDFLSIKEKEEVKLILEETNKVRKCIKIKNLIFFIFGIFLLIGFWYYISAFNAVYNNTQIHLIKDTVISFSTSLLYPFLLIVFPVFFRITSLHFKKKWLYTISKIVIKIINIF